MISRIAGRAIQEGSRLLARSNPPDPNDSDDSVNVFAVVIFMLTLITASVGFILFDYTFQVVKILCIVEDLPSDYVLAPSYDPVASDDADESEDAPKIAPGLYVGGKSGSGEKFITSSFRGTIRYLREEAGFFSAWRGFNINIVYALCASIANGIFESLFPFPFGNIIAGAFVMVAVSPLSLIHTHVVIAPPTKETWFGRLSRLPFKSIIHTLPAAVLVAVTGQITYAFPQIMIKSFIPQPNFDDPSPDPDAPLKFVLTPLQCLAIYSVFLASHVLLFIPSYIILTRVQASVFSVNEDSIIPFERRGPLSIIGAWKTYTWDAKKRLIKLYFKIMPLIWIAALAVGTILFFELRWIMGGKRYVLDTILHQWLKNQNGPAP